MAEPHVVSALVAKRASWQARSRVWSAKRISFGPIFCTSTPQSGSSRRVPAQRDSAQGQAQEGEWFAHGELMRLVLETLRKASDPLTAKELALALMDHKGFETGDERTVRLVEKRVFSVLTRREGSLVEKMVYGPRSSGWKVR